MPRTLSLLAVLSLAACPADPPLDDTAPGATLLTWSQPAEGAATVRTDAALYFTLAQVTADPTADLTVTLSPDAALDLVWDPVAAVVAAYPLAPLQAGTAYTADVAYGGRHALLRFTTGDADAPMPDTDRLCDGPDCAQVTVTSRASRTRSYHLSSTRPQRGDSATTVDFDELAGQPVLRSGSDMFDALFALAVHEARLDAVASISDGSFANGAPLACDCWQTGELWRYVWTRDTAYAVDLALAWLDPERSRTSLEFKLSERKASVGGGQLQIVQDTGSGGSWPISTDRAIWALGARATLRFLDEPSRTAFAERARQALKNTAELDRTVAYDPRDGLYRGEQSFLDWREQSYPSWTANDTVHQGMSKALSTNVAHWVLLDLLAELSQGADATTYRAWAADLATAIDRELWLDDDSGWSTFKTTELDPAPVRHLDLLGASLAATELGGAHAAAAVAAYPRGPVGPPVQWPQLPDAPIYHNRAIWPFVTAYSLRASARTNHAAYVTHDAIGMARSAALNLSNMENYEWLTGATWVDDGPRSGPVVNSRRQLWSVAGYLSMVVDTLFGLDANEEGLRFTPYLPGELRDTLLAGSDTLTLHGFPYRGRSIDVVLRLPAPGRAYHGAMVLTAATLNGADVRDKRISAGDLAADTNTLVLTLTSGADTPSAPPLVLPTASRGAWESPNEPIISSLNLDNGRIQVKLGAPPTGAMLAIYRDGERVADGLSARSWTDPSADPNTSPCYAAEAVWPSTGLRSHHSRAICWWGESFERVDSISVDGFRATGGVYATDHGRPHWAQWGAPSDVIQASYTASHTGRHLISVVYGNGAGPVSTGITGGHKRLSVDGLDVGPLLLPHLGSWEMWGESSFVPVELVSGQTVEFALNDGQNMSYLQHFERYAGGLGGGAEPFHNVNIAEIKVLKR